MKEKKENIKKFWDEYKKAIIGGVVIGGCLGIGYVIGKKSIKIPKLESIDNSWVLTLCEDIDMIRADSTSYVPIGGEDFKQMNFGHTLIRCGEGTEWLDVKGLIAFGDQVEVKS